MEGGVAALFRSGCRIGCAFLSIAGCRGEETVPPSCVQHPICSHLSTSAPIHISQPLRHSTPPPPSTDPSSRLFTPLNPCTDPHFPTPPPPPSTDPAHGASVAGRQRRAGGARARGGGAGGCAEARGVAAARPGLLDAGMWRGGEAGRSWPTCWGKYFLPPRYKL